MTKRLQSITKLAPYSLVAAILLFWQGASDFGLMPKYMLPSPTDVAAAFISDFPLLMSHAGITLAEGFAGLLISVILSFSMAIAMDRYELWNRAAYPLLLLSQTVPTIAIAPLLVLWLGYGVLPKIVLIVITCFFPMTMSLLGGFASADKDTVNLLRAMGASRLQILRHVKLPSSMGHFFSGLRISASYAVVGAVISEWLGGFKGLGVYMIKVKKSYAYDKMFAVILLISIISLLLIKAVEYAQKRCMPWENLTQE